MNTKADDNVFCGTKPSHNFRQELADKVDFLLEF